MHVGEAAGGVIVDDVRVTGGSMDELVLAEDVEMTVELVLVGTGHALHPHFIDSYKTWL